MQQHLMQIQPTMAAYYPNNVTSDHIQQYLDENKSLILKIVESQNSGKINECAENQARLQRNLMYLAAIADSQPQPPAVHSQYPSSGMIQAGSHYMHPQQAQQMTPQSLMAARSSMLYTQQQFAALQQHQQAIQGQLGISSGGLHMLQSEASTSAGSGGFPDFSRDASGRGMMVGGTKQEVGGSVGSSEGRGGSSGGQDSDGGETLYLKSADDGN